MEVCREKMEALARLVRDILLEADALAAKAAKPAAEVNGAIRLPRRVP